MSDSRQPLEAVRAVERGSEAFPLPQTAASRTLDAIINFFGKAVSWLWPLLIAVIVVNVVLRYLFNEGLIVFEELQWHIYAVGFMLGVSYAVTGDRHVRIDVLSEHFPIRTRAWIELVGGLLFLLPFATIVAIEAVPFVERAWRVNEVSAAPGGLPHRWAIKGVIVLAFALLAIAALSRLIRVSALLFGYPRPLPPRDSGSTGA